MLGRRFPPKLFHHILKGFSWQNKVKHHQENTSKVSNSHISFQKIPSGDLGDPLGICAKKNTNTLHPRKLTCIPKIAIFERRYILKTFHLGIYVRFRGGGEYVFLYFCPGGIARRLHRGWSLVEVVELLRAFFGSQDLT